MREADVADSRTHVLVGELTHDQEGEHLITCLYVLCLFVFAIKSSFSSLLVFFFSEREVCFCVCSI